MGKKVLLKSCDEEMFEVDELVALESQILKNLIEDIGGETAIPLPNVTSRILTMVIKYCKYHVDLQQSPHDAKPRVSEDEMKQWDVELANVDDSTLFELMLAADYLDIKNLLDLTCQTAADMTKGKSYEEMRKFLDIKNDYTPEEEEEVKREVQWASE